MGTTVLWAALIVIGSIALVALGYIQGVRRVIKQQNDTTEEVIAQIVKAIVKIEASYRDQRMAHKIYLIYVTAAFHALVADKDLRDALLNEERRRQGVTNPFFEDVEPKARVLKKDSLHLADVVQLSSAKRAVTHVLGNETQPKAPSAPMSSPTPQVDTLTMPVPNGYAETLYRVTPIDDKDVS